MFNKMGVRSLVGWVFLDAFGDSGMGKVWSGLTWAILESLNFRI